MNQKGNAGQRRYAAQERGWETGYERRSTTHPRYFFVNYLCFADAPLGIVFLHAFRIGKPCKL